MAGLQDSVARAVAARLLSRESLGSPDVATRVSGPAHDAYLHGVYFARRAWQRPDSRAIEDSAIRYFQRALAIDPAYAVAHASIAEMYTRRFFNYDPNPEWEQRAFSEIEKALAIDPNLPEAYQAKGNLTWTRANAFPHEAAAKLHRRATALKPSFVEPHQSLGSLYMHIGLLDSALAEFATALDLDPATPLVPPRIARVHWYQGKYDVALRELEAIDKPLVSFAAERALILNYLGRSSEALSYLNGLQGSSEESYDFAAARAVIHASRGERALALSAIARALQGGEKASHFHHAEYSIAEAYALLGDKDRALEFLRKTAEVLKVAIVPEGASEISRRSRGTPRIANRLLRRVRDYAQVKGNGTITRDIANEALQLLDVDQFGLDDMDTRILKSIIEKFEGGPVGVNTIAAAVGEDASTIEEVYEPFLVQNGFLQRTPRGRMATSIAYRHFGYTPPAQQNQGSLFEG
jgi:tetratricopeptide (TPR) repeat protein